MGDEPQDIVFSQEVGMDLNLKPWEVRSSKTFISGIPSILHQNAHFIAQLFFCLSNQLDSPLDIWVWDVKEWQQWAVLFRYLQWLAKHYGLLWVSTVDDPCLKMGCDLLALLLFWVPHFEAILLSVPSGVIPFWVKMVQDLQLGITLFFCILKKDEECLSKKSMSRGSQLRNLSFC